MKKYMVLLLSLATLLPVAAGAASVEERYQSSPWAWESVVRAADLGLARKPVYSETTEPIRRGDFGENAAALAALAYDTDLQVYLNARNFTAEMEGRDPWDQTPAAVTLGILEGRGGGDLDLEGFITRQEAAVMLARAYDIYADGPAGDGEALSYADQGEIADWAREDVALMTRLGIMNGVGENRFDPLGNYTVEQCFVTLVRLYEQTVQGAEPLGEDPFALSPLEAAVGEFWDGYDLLDYVEREDQFVMSWCWVSGSMLGSKYFISVFDGDWNRQDYRTVISMSSDAHYGPKDAPIEALSLSEDGARVFYQGTVQGVVYDYDAAGNQGEKLFDPGVYTVTVDLTTGEQTWTRSDLP